MLIITDTWFFYLDRKHAFECKRCFLRKSNSEVNMKKLLIVQCCAEFIRHIVLVWDDKSNESKTKSYGRRTQTIFCYFCVTYFSDWCHSCVTFMSFDTSVMNRDVKLWHLASDFYILFLVLFSPPTRFKIVNVKQKYNVYYVASMSVWTTTSLYAFDNAT